MANKDFMVELCKVINDFNEFQIENNVPYNYDTIGLQQWLLFDNGLDMTGEDK